MSVFQRIGLILLTIILHLNLSAEEFLLFPPTAPTRVQIITGIGFPVDLKLESVTFGYVLKAEYWLPVNASNYLDILGDPFNPTPLPITKRRRRRLAQSDKSKDVSVLGYDGLLKQKYEKYEAEAVEIPEHLVNTENPQQIIEYSDDGDGDSDGDGDDDDDNDSGGPYNGILDNSILEDLKKKQPNDFDTSRWTLYKAIETVAGMKGIQGRSCLLRTICEAAQVPFSYSSGILSELMHIVLTPSSSIDQLNRHSDNEYLKAEKFGKSGAPCDKIFKECTISILNKFSGIYDNLANIIIQAIG